MTTESLIVRKDTDLSQHRKNVKNGAFNAYARGWMSAVLVLSDTASLVLALTLAVGLLLGTGFNWPAYQELLGILLLAFMVAFLRSGLYPGIGLNYVEELRRVVVTISYVFLIVIAYTFLVKTSSFYSRPALLLTWLLALGLVPAARYLARRTCIRLKCWGEPVAIIGDLDKALPLANYFKGKTQFGLRPVAVMRKDNCKDAFSEIYPPLSPDKIKEIAQGLHIKTALVVVSDLNHMDPMVDKYRYCFESVILIKHQLGSFGLNSLKPLDFSDVLGLQVRNNLLNPGSQVVKRSIDILASGLGLVLLSPFLLLILVLIKLDSPGWFFYRQPRVGRGNRTFNLLKFRTMYENGDELLKQKLLEDRQMKEEWDQYQKIKNDPRITHVGRVLRKFSLDELPQLWNVLLGEMSLVGPRPMMLGQQKLYGEQIKDYVRVRPGMTGLWQISGRNQTTFIRRAQLDGEYIQKWSLWMDIYILLATVKVVLLREGAF